MRHFERHLIDRTNWLRAAVLGANDGILSTASLIVGVAAAPGAHRAEILLAGVAGLVAGAMSMAAGEYVSVSSQADSEAADLARERRELASDPLSERAELSAIYRSRGVRPQTADAVARQLMAHDALAAHAQDELGLSARTFARPVQAAAASALSFAIGAAAPLAVALLVAPRAAAAAVAGASILVLMALGAIGARAGGAPMGRAALRVTFWGVLAMAVTAGIGRLVGTSL